jgi:hypothetical protein
MSLPLTTTGKVVRRMLRDKAIAEPAWNAADSDRLDPRSATGHAADFLTKQAGNIAGVAVDMELGGDLADIAVSVRMKPDDHGSHCHAFATRSGS